MSDLLEFILAKARLRKALWLALGDDAFRRSGGMRRRPFADLADLAYLAAARAGRDERRTLAALDDLEGGA